MMTEIINSEDIKDKPLVISQEVDTWVSLMETGLSSFPVNINKYSTGRIIILDSTNQKPPVFSFDIGHKKPTIFLYYTWSWNDLI